MDYYCDVCLIIIKPKSKYKHKKLNADKQFDECKHIKLTFENPNINNVDRTFYDYVIQLNKEYDYYLVKC